MYKLFKISMLLPSWLVMQVVWSVILVLAILLTILLNSPNVLAPKRPTFASVSTFYRESLVGIRKWLSTI